MRGWIGVSVLTAVLAMGAASSALAHSPAPQDKAREAILSADSPGEEFLIADQRIAPVSPGLDDEIIVACLRLPTLADLSKERWNEVHRRFDGRRGRPLRKA